jgi:DeoR family fructose operon transcriptional repressor
LTKIAVTIGYPAPVNARHSLLIQWLADEGRLNVADVANRLSVGQETVRRDLRNLENSGRLQRVHGGAVPVEAHPFPTLTLPVSKGTEIVLGRMLWAELPREGTILLEAGRPTLALAMAINVDPPAHLGLTVVTNSLDIATVLADTPRVSVYNTGGVVSSTTGAQEGEWTLQELNRLRVDVSLICPAGLTIDAGLGQTTPTAAAASATAVACARVVFALAEPEHLGRTALAHFAAVDKIDRLVVFGQPDQVVLEPLLQHGLQVTVLATNSAGSWKSDDHGWPGLKARFQGLNR